MQRIILTLCFLLATTILASCGSTSGLLNKTITTDSPLHTLKDHFPASIALASLGAGKEKENAMNTSTAADTCPLEKGNEERSKVKFSELVSSLEKQNVINKLPIDTRDKEINEAFELVRSGQFRQDIKSSLKKIYSINKDPAYILADIQKTPNLIVALESAILKDFQIRLPRANCAINAITGLIKNKNAVSKECLPSTFDNTIDALYEVNTIAKVAASARIFTDPNNRSSRVAIIIYARSQGINISEDDLNTLHRFLDPNEEDHKLEDVVNTGIKKFGDKYHLKDIQAVVGKIDAGNKNCSI